MKRTTSLLVAAAAIAAPTTALAKTIEQEGTFVGDDAAVVTLKVKTEGKNPTGIAGFRATNVTSRCGDQQGLIDFRIKGTVQVEGNNRFDAKLNDGKGGVLRVTGKVTRGGKSVVGNLKARGFESTDGQTCQDPEAEVRDLEMN